MNIDGDNFNQPSLRDLELLQAQSTSESWVNGRSSFEKIYILSCTQSKGNLTIKQATIEYNGQVYKPIQ
jgi:hypothetical protein